MIWVDLDNTLVYACDLDAAPSSMIKELRAKMDGHETLRYLKEFRKQPKEDQIAHWRGLGCAYVEDEQRVVFPRPHFRTFLSALETIGVGGILTSGGTDYQRIIAHSVGISLPVYGADSYGKVPRDPNPYLVDDLGFNTMGVQHKMHALNVPEDQRRARLMQCESFSGNPNDKDLLRVMHELRGK